MTPLQLAIRPAAPSSVFKVKTWGKSAHCLDHGLAFGRQLHGHGPTDDDRQILRGTPDWHESTRIHLSMGRLRILWRYRGAVEGSVGVDEGSDAYASPGRCAFGLFGAEPSAGSSGGTWRAASDRAPGYFTVVRDDAGSARVPTIEAAADQRESDGMPVDCDVCDATPDSRAEDVRASQGSMNAQVIRLTPSNGAGPTQLR